MRPNRERAEALLREPEFMDEVLDSIAEGGTLASIATEKQIPYRMLYGFIMSDEDRADAYDEASNARNANINDRVISGIVGVADSDVRELYDDDGDFRNVKELPRHVAAAVSAVDITVDDQGKQTKKVRFHDKMRALEMMGRTQKMFTDKVSHEGIVRLEDLVQESMKGAKGEPVKSE